MDNRAATTAALATLLLWRADTAPAQQPPVVGSREHVALERPEGWAMAYTSAATLNLAFGPPRARETGDLALGADFGSIPHVSSEDARVGFDGFKFEDLNKTPVFGRARFWLGLPADFTLEFSWTPPVSIGGAKPDDMFGLALERPLLGRGDWRLGARLFGFTGRVHGDITCPSEVAEREPGSEGNLFGCRAPSDDRVSLDHYGLELIGSKALAGGRWEPFAGFALSRMDVQVQVDAHTFDVIDRSVRSTDGTIRTVRAGLLYSPSERWQWSISGDYTPLDVRRPPERDKDNDPFWSVRLMGRYAF